MWQPINLVVWLAAVGVTFAGAPARAAAAGWLVVACWQHAAARDVQEPQGAADHGGVAAAASSASRGTNKGFADERI